VPGPVAVPVVFDVNVLVLAVAVGESPFRSWPSPPPTSGNPSADCLGVVNDAAEFALWLSLHSLAESGRILATLIRLLGGIMILEARDLSRAAELLTPRTSPIPH